MVIKPLIYTEVSELIINHTEDKVKYVDDHKHFLFGLWTVWDPALITSNNASHESCVKLQSQVRISSGVRMSHVRSDPVVPQCSGLQRDYLKGVLNLCWVHHSK